MNLGEDLESSVDRFAYKKKLEDYKVPEMILHSFGLQISKRDRPEENLKRQLKFKSSAVQPKKSD